MKLSKFEAGERHRTSRLTNADIYAIRADYDAKKDAATEAKKWKISKPHWRRIGQRKVWKHLPELETK